MSLGPLVILERDIYAEIPAISITKIDTKAMKYLLSLIFDLAKARLVKMATLRTGTEVAAGISTNKLFSVYRATMISIPIIEVIDNPNILSICVAIHSTNSDNMMMLSKNGSIA
jgi:hypothetical protein